MTLKNRIITHFVTVNSDFIIKIVTLFMVTTHFQHKIIPLGTTTIQPSLLLDSQQPRFVLQTHSLSRTEFQLVLNLYQSPKLRSFVLDK
mgnify:CR=1 FL=1